MVDVCSHHLTIEGISVLNEGFLTLGVGGLVGLSQIPPGLLSNVSLLEGLCKGSHRHVLPFALAPVVLLHHHSSFQSQNIYFDSETSSLHCKSKLTNAWDSENAFLHWGDVLGKLEHGEDAKLGSSRLASSCSDSLLHQPCGGHVELDARCTTAKILVLCGQTLGSNVVVKQVQLNVHLDLMTCTRKLVTIIKRSM